MPATDFQGATSSFANFGRSILNIRRDQVHSMDSPHGGATIQELELETFQKQVAERFNELLCADSSELLSIPWIRLMVQLLGVFATMPFIFTALADGSRLV